MDTLTLWTPEHFALQPDRAEVFSWLRCTPDLPCYAAFRAAWDQALALSRAVEARGAVHREEDGTLTACVTLGAAPEKQASALFAGKEYVLGSLYNVLLDELLFQAEAQLAEGLRVRLAGEGLYIANRLEPGLGLSPASLRQRFAWIPAVFPEAALSEHGVLYPAKSMLYGVVLSPHPCGSGRLHDCSRCPQRECLYRKASPKKNEE